ncbi:hypothetical protein BB560_000410 [Smittium megazygosporum]|uniref:Cation-transporting ATPase n=1 Tax=Smittium megazygosporum TaxID=133381 RepID=A0A2T9ZKG9_9FUNG|nr:hypothetical protein BB560_000410 [Smittium megazygosporum]
MKKDSKQRKSNDINVSPSPSLKIQYSSVAAHIEPAAENELFLNQNFSKSYQYKSSGQRGRNSPIFPSSFNTPLLSVSSDVSLHRNINKSLENLTVQDQNKTNSNISAQLQLSSEKNIAINKRFSPNSAKGYQNGSALTQSQSHLSNNSYLPNTHKSTYHQHRAAENHPESSSSSDESDSDEDNHFQPERENATQIKDSAKAVESNTIEFQGTIAELEYFVPNPSQNSQDIFLSHENFKISIHGMVINKTGEFFYKLLCFLTLGIFYIISQWFPSIKISLTMTESDLSDATHIFIKTETNESEIKKINSVFFGGKLHELFGYVTASGPLASYKDAIVSQIKSFDYRHHRFIYHPYLSKFVHSGLWKSTEWVETPKSIRYGITPLTRSLLASIFGINDIEIEQKSTISLLIEEIINPFYIFQFASVFLWLFDNYYYYAGCILTISIVSIVNALIETKSNSKKIQQMAKFECTVDVFRDGLWRIMSSKDLVPGDIISTTSGNIKVIPCDALLLEGSCIMNESMLTGESIPVVKTPALAETLKKIDLTLPTYPLELSKHILFSGTNIIRSKKNEIGFGGKEWIRIDTQYQKHGTDTENLFPDFPQHGTALVIRTGFNTSKGVMIRSIMFPRNLSFKLYIDSFKFIAVLAIIAVLGFIFSAINFVRIGLSFHVIIVRALDLITVVVPPALPASLSIGTSFSLGRLKSKLIYCISPSRINVCGRINLMAFDKTGTLTEEGLDVLGVQTNNLTERTLNTLVDDVASFAKTSGIDYDFKKLDFLHALATCHSIKSISGELIGDPLDIKMFQSTEWSLEELDPEISLIKNKTETLKDNPSDSKKLKKRILPTIVRPPAEFKRKSSSPLSSQSNSNTVFEVPGELGIVKTFDFSPSLRRMSVIVRHPTQKGAQFYTKGAPETIRDLCLSETIPQGFSQTLSDNARNGYRNKLKPASEDVIHQLSMANIRNVMCTGDNIFTAISVAKHCGIIQPSAQVYIPVIVDLDKFGHNDTFNYSALQGKVVMWQNMDNPLRFLDPYSFTPISCRATELVCTDIDSSKKEIIVENLGKLITDPTIDEELVRTGNYTIAVTGDVFRYMIDEQSEIVTNRALTLSSVFARMSPDQKGELMEFYSEIGYCVGFCGDGANDCSALKSADVGLSLSEAEASVAAPFTSKTTDIRCVIDVIKEGRAALTTSFSCFKYMALYSMIQFSTVSLLYRFGGGLGDFQFLYIDLFIIFPLSITMAWALPFDRISTKPPAASLISKKVLTSLFCQIFIVASFQIVLDYVVQKQGFYKPPVRENPEDFDNILVKSYENTSLFLLSNFQYIGIAWIFSIGKPYRQSNTKNTGFVLSFLSLVAFSSILLLKPSTWVKSVFELLEIPKSFCILIFLLGFGGFVFSYTGEHYIFPKLSHTFARYGRIIKKLSKAVFSLLSSKSASFLNDYENLSTSDIDYHSVGSFFPLVVSQSKLSRGSKSQNAYKGFIGSNSRYEIERSGFSGSQTKYDVQPSYFETGNNSFDLDENVSETSRRSSGFLLINAYENHKSGFWGKLTSLQNSFNDWGQKSSTKPYKKILQSIGKIDSK